MVEFPWGQLITAAGTLGGAAVGGLMGHWLSRDKHKRDRIWDLRVEAGSEILHAMHRGLGKLQGVKSYYEEDPHRADASDRVRSLKAEAYEELATASATFRKNLLILGSEFVVKYDDYGKALDAIDDELDPPDSVDAVIAAVAAALPGLERQAREDTA